MGPLPDAPGDASREPAPAPEAPSGRPDPAELVPAGPRQLHPLPPGLVELYGLLAVLFVLVPEWMAGGALLGLGLGRDDADLPTTSAAWSRIPELRLATLSLAELRLLARKQRIAGYGRLGRQRLTLQLLKQLKPSRRSPGSL